MNGTLSYSGTSFIQVHHCFTWEVPEFFSLSSEDGYFLQSDEFRHAGDLYCLRLYPTGIKKYDNDPPSVDILLVRLASSVAEKDISYEIGYRSKTGIYCKVARDNDGVESVGKYAFWMDPDVLEEEKDHIVPDGKLTVYCRILGEFSVATGVDKLQSDYKRLMLKGAESDACLVVRGKEFQAHKCVLRARSPVFEAMFGHETTEKASGRVIIDDLKPDRFQDFLEYLYTGRVKSFSDDNVFELYVAADKYDVPILKSECVEYMSGSLSVENLCDVVTVALRHNEKDLMALAVDFFKKNQTSILLTVKWEQFLSENSARANELLIKASCLENSQNEVP